MAKSLITLEEALKTDQLKRFIAQEEARGIGAIERVELEATIAEALRRSRTKSRKPHSKSVDGSSK